MRAVLLVLFSLCTAIGATSARASESIAEVLLRSQQMQFDALAERRIDDADPRVAKIRNSFERARLTLRTAGEVQLIVVDGPLLAVCLMGRVVAANVSVAALSEAERAFILGHELGHIALGHWAELVALYQRHIPGEVVREKTDPGAFALGRDASALSHRHEFEADAFALRLLRALGEPEDTPAALFLEHLPLVKGTATHPGTHQRLAQMRALP